MLAALLQEFCDEPGPAGLVAGADARAVVAVKIFIEEQVILPLRIGLESFRTAEHRPAAAAIFQERCQ